MTQLMASLRQMAIDKGLEDTVRFTGRIPDAELLQILSTADLCVNPDRPCEMNSMSTMIKIMEYMAFEKPIVTFDLKETHFSAQDAAVYVPPNQEAEFAKAIAKLMDNPELRQKMGAAGRMRVERDLQWSIVGRNLLAAYARLLT